MATEYIANDCLSDLSKHPKLTKMKWKFCTAKNRKITSKYVYKFQSQDKLLAASTQYKKLNLIQTFLRIK